MKKQTILKSLMIGACVLTLAGCGTKGAEIQGEKDMPVTEQSQNDGSGTEKESTDPETEDVNGNGSTEQSMLNEDAASEKQNNTVDAESLYTSSAVTGSVVDFSDAGCTVSVVVTEDDGATAVSAAPGYENEDTNVEVTYQEDCVVQSAAINTSTGIAELEQASVADITKQASVIIYGSFEDTHHVTATKIIICYYIS